MDSHLNNIDEEKLHTYQTRFLTGILIYSICTCLFNEILPGKIFNFIQSIGLGMFFLYWLKLCSWKNVSNMYLRIAISLLIIWEIFIVLHGFIFSYDYIKDLLFVNNRAIAYVLPLAVFINVNNSFFLKKTFRYAYKMGIYFLIFFIPFPFYIFYNMDFVEQYVWMLGIPCGFILITSTYHSKKYILIALIVMILSLLLVTIWARRNIMLTAVMFIGVSFFIIPLINIKTPVWKKFLFLFIFIFATLSTYVVYESNQTGLFYAFTKRAGEDTRETVFFYYFMDMSNKDWLIGKGANGTYFCPGIDREWSGGEDTAHRDLDDRIYIENGFLQLILNGGLIYLLLYFSILLPAIIKGLFFSRNIFCKGCALLIFLFILDMIPFGLPTFSLRHFIVWFCVAICFSKEMREKNEEKMVEFLNFQNA